MKTNPCNEIPLFPKDLRKLCDYCGLSYQDTKHYLEHKAQCLRIQARNLHVIEINTKKHAELSELEEALVAESMKYQRELIAFDFECALNVAPNGSYKHFIEHDLANFIRNYNKHPFVNKSRKNSEVPELQKEPKFNPPDWIALNPELLEMWKDFKCCKTAEETWEKFYKNDQKWTWRKIKDLFDIFVLGWGIEKLRDITNNNDCKLTPQELIFLQAFHLYSKNEDLISGYKKWAVRRGLRWYDDKDVEQARANMDGMATMQIMIITYCKSKFKKILTIKKSDVTPASSNLKWAEYKPGKTTVKILS